MGAGLNIDRSLSASRAAPAGASRSGRRGCRRPRRAHAAGHHSHGVPADRLLNDRGGSESSGDGRFDLSGPDTLLPPIDRAPHNKRFYDSHARALERYYDVQSFGRVVLQVDVWPAESDSAYHLNDLADLGPWAFGQGVYRAAVDMSGSCSSRPTRSPPRRASAFRGSRYDRFMIVHAGSDLQATCARIAKHDIPSFTVFLGDTDVVVFPDSAQWNLDRPIDRACFIPDDQPGRLLRRHQRGDRAQTTTTPASSTCTTSTRAIPWRATGRSWTAATWWARVYPDQTEIYAVGLLPPTMDPVPAQLHRRRDGHSPARVATRRR